MAFSLYKLIVLGVYFCSGKLTRAATLSLGLHIVFYCLAGSIHLALHPPPSSYPLLPPLPLLPRPPLIFFGILERSCIPGLTSSNKNGNNFAEAPP